MEMGRIREKRLTTLNKLFTKLQMRRSLLKPRVDETAEVCAEEAGGAVGRDAATCCTYSTESGHGYIHGHGEGVSRQPQIVFTDTSPRFTRDKSIQLRYPRHSLACWSGRRASFSSS